MSLAVAPEMVHRGLLVDPIAVRVGLPSVKHHHVGDVDRRFLGDIERAPFRWCGDRGSAS